MVKGSYFGPAEEKGFSLASKCPFYGKVEEVIKHLFIHCPMIWSL